jgi:hypothetical protein
MSWRNAKLATASCSTFTVVPILSCNLFCVPFYVNRHCTIIKKKRKKNEKKTKSNARKRSGDNENAILWTPVLTPFAQMDTLGPKGLGFLLYEGGLKGT